jgi:hypothetical protein
LLIAQCADVADINACVHLRATTHRRCAAAPTPAGTALCDDGLVVDQSRTKEVRVFRGFKGVEAATALHAVALRQPGPQMALTGCAACL